MSYMFNHCESLTQLDLKKFNTINVRDMSYMFSHCSSLEKLNLLSFNINEETKLTQIFKPIYEKCKIEYNDKRIHKKITKFCCSIF